MKKLLFKFAKKSLAIFMACLMIMSTWVFFEPVHAAQETLYYSLQDLYNTYLTEASGAKFTNGKFTNDSAEYTADGLYVNVLYSPAYTQTDIYTGVASNGSKLGVDSGCENNYNSMDVDWHHAETVMLYDGVTAPRTGVMVTTDPNQGGSWDGNSTVERVWMTNSNLAHPSYWKGICGANLDFTWAMTQGDQLNYLSTTTDSKKVITRKNADTVPVYANYMQYTGSMDSTKYIDEILPAFSLYVYDSETSKTISATSSKYVRVVNYKSLKEAIVAAKSYIGTNIIGDEEYSSRYTSTSIAKLQELANALVAAKPDTTYFDGNSKCLYNEYAADAKAAVDAWNKWIAAGGLEVAKYTVKYVSDGTELQSDTVDYGTMTPAYTGTPTKASDATNHYTYKGWDKTIADKVTANVTYTATFNAIAHTYTHSSNNDGKAHTSRCSCGYTVTSNCSGGTVNCTTDGVCSTCGQIYAPRLGHTWIEATCTAAKTCSVCGATEGVPKGHTYQENPAEEYFASGATCINYAKYYKSCSECGAKGSETFDHVAGGYGSHSIPSESKKGQAASCLNPGSKEYWECIICNKKFADANGNTEITDTVIPAAGHIFGATVPAKDVTCTVDGNLAYKQCTVCKLYFAGDAANNSTDGKATNASFIIKTSGTHTYTYVQNADGTTHTGTCKCGATETGTCSGGRATCLDAAVCSTCGGVYSKALGHNFGAVTEYKAATCLEDGNEAYKRCSRCLKYFDADAAKDSTETHDTANDFIIEALDHDFNVPFTVDKKASCTAVGSKSKHCSREDCNVKSEVTEIPKRDHVLEDTTVRKAATCTATGIMNQKCSNIETDEYLACAYITTRVIDAKGHSFTEIAYNAPTCTEDGNEAHKYCETCGEYFAADADKFSTDGKSTADDYIIDALDHDFATEYTVDSKASCTETGSKSKHCSRCSEKTDVTVIPKRAHVIVDDSIQTDATCTETGIMNQKCSNIETDEYLACGYTTTRVIDAKGHKFGATVAYKAPTCTETGNEAYKPCSACGKYYAADAAADSTDAKDSADAFIIPALQHDFDEEFTIDKYATCTDPGEKSRHCKREGCNAKTDITEIPATGEHVYAIEVPGTRVEPKCTENGSVILECGCGKDSPEPTIIPMLGHADADTDHVCDNGCGEFQGEHKDDNKDHLCDYGCISKFGTCEDTVKDHYCDYGCGKYYGTHEDTNKDHNCDYGCAEALGDHSDLENDGDHLCDYCNERDVLWVCTKGEEVRENEIPATCDAEGKYNSVYYCTECNTELSRQNDVVIKKLPHDWNETVYTWAEDGSSCVATHICKNFETHFEEDTAEITSAIENDATCTENGTTRYTATFKVDWAETQINDILDIPAKGHADTDKNHKCDNGCDIAQGEHKDINLDHKCDYGCKETIGKHEDAGKDHKCDYGCYEKVGECSDSATDNDHVCDYGCGKILTKCEDKDLDHVCDNGCDVEFGKCEDTDKDHKCDYGCDIVFGGECADVDPLDHACDYCGELLSGVIDPDKDHNCDCGCGLTVGKCEDKDLDHKCDYGCDKVYGECVDKDKDHVCDYGCGKDDFGKHEDTDNDHNCDYGCDEKLSIHMDANKDHICDNGCNVTIGECGDSDTDNDHNCDYGCDKTYGECKDDDKDHLCDLGCGKGFGKHEDAEKDGDHLCEYCNKVASEHNKGEAKTENEVKATCGAAGKYDTVYYCTECDYEIERTETVVPQLSHDWDVDAIKYVWNTDGSACSAVCVCKNDAKHTERVSAEITSEVVEEATCNNPGSTKYTATFAEDWLEDQTKTIADLATIDHKDVDPKDHKCDYDCGKEDFGTHEDKNADHICDYGCEETIGTHADSDDKDHLCDYCGVSLGECKDDDKDHICDYGCEEYQGEHKDEDKDHVCDYGCKVTIGECADNDKNHECDYGCGKNDFGTHGDSDTDNDHVCDYGCGDVLEECEDADKDHACDFGCDKVYGKHEDTNTDHVCDYGCEETIGECVDNNKNHECDYGCDVEFGKCEDTDKDHKCDYEGCTVTYGECKDSADDKDHVCDYGCKAVLESCVDSEKNHECDICEVQMGACEDKNKDHNCDYGCGKDDFGTCEDKNTDHKCDYGCDKSYGTCADSETDNDHVCDYGCEKVLEKCEDADKNHECDNGCDTEFGTHEDTNNDHKCDYGCKVTIGECADNNNDHYCDYGCGKDDFGECKDSATDKDHVCDYGCGKNLEDCADSDTDKDHKCDVCGKDEITDHNWMAATCTAPKTCSICEKTEGTAANHSFTKVISTTAATCISEGEIVYECTTCPTGENLKAATKTVPVEINRRNHASEGIIIVNDVAPECAKAGYTGDVYHECCYDPNKTAAQNKSAFISAGSVIPATEEHKLVDAVPEYLVQYVEDAEGNITDYTAKEDTLTYEAKIACRRDDNNWYHVQKCADCGTIVEGACYTYAHTANCVETDICEVCDGLCSIKEPGKHAGSLKQIGAVDATCSKPGKKAYYECTACKKSFFDAGAKQEITDANKNDLVVPATGNHKIDETKTPKSNGNGTHTYSCTVCSTPVTKTCTGGEATCQASAVCEYCKTAYGSKNPDKHAKGTIVLGRVEADKCKPGVTGKEVYECCPDVVVYAGTEIPAISDHTWVESKPETDNCELGYTITKTCSYCGETKTTEVTAGKHELTKVVYETEKDCTKERKVYYACKNCGFADKTIVVSGKTYNYISVEVIPAKGQCSWSSWTYEQKATCVTEGKRTRTCSVCKKVETETLSKIAHTIKTEKGFAPTCDAQGKQDYVYCTVSNCPYRKGGQPIGTLKGYEKYKNSTGADIPALGHQDKNGDDYCDNCGRFEGTTSGGNCNCICHKNNGLMKFFYKILNFFWKLFKIEKKCACGVTHW